MMHDDWLLVACYGFLNLFCSLYVLSFADCVLCVSFFGHGLRLSMTLWRSNFFTLVILGSRITTGSYTCIIHQGCGILSRELVVCILFLLQVWIYFNSILFDTISFGFEFIWTLNLITYYFYWVLNKGLNGSKLYDLIWFHSLVLKLIYNWVSFSAAIF